MLLTNRCIGTVARMGGVPFYYSEFLDSFADLIQFNHEYLCNRGDYIHYPKPPKVSVHDVARNSIVQNFLGDFLFMLDSDHSFEPDILARLLHTAAETKIDVVTGLYQYKTFPHSPTLYKWRGDEKTGGLYPIGEWSQSANIIEVDSAGAGCLLIRRRVFDRIRDELNEQPFERLPGYGEDHSFFLRLRKLGVKSVCDTRVECHHLIVKRLGIGDYDPKWMDLGEPVKVGGYR